MNSTFQLINWDGHMLIVGMCVDEEEREIIRQELKLNKRYQQ